MILVDLGDYEVKMTPLEKTVYHLFMENPNGIRASEIVDYHDDITKLYDRFFNGSNIAKFLNSIEALCDYQNGSMQEKISRINYKLRDTIGEELSEPYIIQKSLIDDKYKILLDRDLVSYED